MPTVWNKRDPNTPSNAVYVGRPTQYGNRWSHVGDVVARSACLPATSRTDAVQKYRVWLNSDDPLAVSIRNAARKHLRGADLVCWCVRYGGIEFHPAIIRDDCHCFPLMEVANG